MSKISTSFLAIIFFISILLPGCKSENKKYTVIITDAAMGAKGVPNLTEKKEEIIADNDSLAYSDGARNFMSHKLTNILLGIDTNQNKPVSFQVLNSKGEDISRSLDARTIINITAIWNEMYHKQINETVERRKQVQK